MNILERVFGANWRTSVSGIGSKLFLVMAMLAALPYEKDNPGSMTAQIWALIPPDWQPKVLKACMLSALILGVVNAIMQKDKSVIGNGTIMAPNRVPDGTGGNKVLTSAVLLALLLPALLLPALFLSGCVTGPDGKQHPDYARIEGVAAQIILSELGALAQTELSGGKIDKSWALAQGLNGISVVARNLDNQQTAALIKTAVAQQTSNDPKFTLIGEQLAGTFIKANPVTPQEKSAALVALGMGTQMGTAAAASAMDAKGVKPLGAARNGRRKMENGKGRALAPIERALVWEILTDRTDLMHKPFATIAFRHERIVDPVPAGSDSADSAAVWMRPMVVTRMPEVP